jgi:MFS transporter
VRYRELLRVPFFVTAAVGRVGIAASALAVVLLVQHRTGSYSVAGLVAGCFAAAEAVAGPQTARLIDRYGQTTVLPPLLLGHAAAAAVLLAAGPRWTLALAGLLLGATIPQLGALSATRWAAMLDPDALPVAFALESLANSAAFLIGPVLVSAIAAAGHPVLGPIVAAGLIVAGGLGLAAQRSTAPPSAARRGSGLPTSAVQRGSAPPPSVVQRGAALPPSAGQRGAAPPSAARIHRSRMGSLLLRPVARLWGAGGRRGRRAAFLTLAGLNAALGVFFGAVPVAVTAFTTERHLGYAVTTLFAVSSGASVLGGWLYGRRPRFGFAAVGAVMALGGVPLALAAVGLPSQLVSAVVGLAGQLVSGAFGLAGQLVSGAFGLAGQLVSGAGGIFGGALPRVTGALSGELLVGAGLGLTGLVIPAILVLSNVRTTRIVDRSVLTQAYTWLNTASVAGSAAASSATGWAVDHGGAGAGLLIAAAATAGVALLAAVAQPRSEGAVVAARHPDRP